MKILRVVTTMNPASGGVAACIRQNAQYMSCIDGYQVDVLTFDDPNAPWIKEETNFKIIGLGKKYSHYAINKKYISWLHVHANEYDAVFLDGLWQYHMLGGYVLKKMKVPFFVYSHGMLDPYFNKDRKKYLKKLPFWFLVERNVLNMANGVIFTCAEERDLAKKSFPFFKGNAFIATLGVESKKQEKDRCKRVFYENHPELKDKNFGLFLSRIDPKKGVDLLIEAFSKLENDQLLVIAGPDRHGMRERLEARLVELGIANRVVWCGMLTGDVKWGAYFAADYFILPSHQENFGIVVAEALSTGTPVLITNKVNIWREIEAEEAGYIADDNVQGVSKLLSNWWEMNSSEKEKMSRAASKCFDKYFSIESAEKDFMSVLSSLNPKS